MFHKLHISSTLLTKTAWEGKRINLTKVQYDKLQRMDFEEKQKLAGYMVHELNHAIFGETFAMTNLTQRAAEKRAWSVQGKFLRKLRNDYLLDPGRLASIDAAIDDADDGLA